MVKLIEYDGRHSFVLIIRVYANQIKIVDHSNLKATVRYCYYNGSYYLIEANFNNEIILIENKFEIKKGIEISIVIEK